MVCCGGKPAAKEAPAAKKKAAAASGKPEKTVSADSTPAEVDETAQRIAEQLHGTKGIDDLGRRDATLTLHERVLAAANGEEKPEDAVYLNMVLLNKNDVVKNMMNEKAGYHDTKKPGWFMQRVGGMAANHATDADILNKVAPVIVGSVPQKIKETGIMVDCKVVEFLGPYICFKLTFDDEAMDLKTLLTKAKGSEYANDFVTMAALVRKCGLTDSADKLKKQGIDKAHVGVASTLTTSLPVTLFEKGIMTDCIAVRSKLQGEFQSELLAMLGLSGDSNIIEGQISKIQDVDVEVEGEIEEEEIAERSALNAALAKDERMDDPVRRNQVRKLHRRISMEMGQDPKVEPEDAVYINLVLMNRTEVIEKLMQSKVGNNFFAGGLAGLAGNVVTDEKVMQGVGDVLKEAVPAKIREAGIGVESMTLTYRHGPYLVMKLVVDDAATDMGKILTASNSAEYAEQFLTLAACLEFLEMKDKADNLKATIQTKTRNGICATLTGALPKQLYEKGLLVDCVCIRSAFQGQFQSELVTELGLFTAPPPAVDNGVS